MIEGKCIRITNENLEYLSSISSAACHVLLEVRFFRVRLNVSSHVEPQLARVGARTSTSLEHSFFREQATGRSLWAKTHFLEGEARRLSKAVPPLSRRIAVGLTSYPEAIPLRLPGSANRLLALSFLSGRCPV
jgi:hypothetical protein